MQQTPNYNLPQFEGTDFFNKEALNDAFIKIDTSISDLQETINISNSGSIPIINEVIEARKGKTNLLSKINEIDSSIDKNAQDIILNSQKTDTLQAKISQVEEKAIASETKISSIETNITGMTTKLDDVYNLKNNGGEINGNLTVNKEVIIEDGTNVDTKYKIKGDLGKFSVSKINSQTPSLEDEMFSVTYGEDGSSKTFNFGESQKSSDGYTMLPNGFIMQWGVIGSTLEGRFKNVDVTFPISFNSGVKVFLNCDWLSGTSSPANLQCNASKLSNTGFTATFKADDSMFATSGFSAQYFAIGY